MVAMVLKQHIFLQLKHHTIPLTVTFAGAHSCFSAELMSVWFAEAGVVQLRRQL